MQGEIEEMQIADELKFKDNFTLLQDKRPSKNFLNLESSKGGYNEITWLREPNPNFDPSQDETETNVKLNTLKNQDIIRDKFTGQFQKFYDIQHNLKTST